MSVNFTFRARPARIAVSIFASAFTLALLISCGSRPTVTPVPTLDVVGTVTALARPVAATQAALLAFSTQVAASQATASALAAVGATQEAGATQAAQAQRVAAATAAAATAAAQANATSAAATGQAAAGAQTAQAATATALANSLAVQAATATAIAAANATAFSRATVNAAVTPTPTPAPPTATPTLAPTASPTANCVPANSAFAAIIGKAATAGLDVGCTTGAAFSTDQGALQEYWANAANTDPATHLRSLMIWRGDNRQVYVVKGQDTQATQGSVLLYNDTYQEGSADVPPACAALQPPAGYRMPVRGFGKVWCDNKLEPAIGWPNRAEVAATLQMQLTQRGLLMKVSAPSVGLGYLVAIDLRSQRAVTAPVAP